MLIAYLFKKNKQDTCAKCIFLKITAQYEMYGNKTV